MKAIVTTEFEAKSLQDIIAKALRYPKSGINVPGGEHAPSDECSTILYVEAFSHPDGTPWACPVDSTVEAIPSTPEEMARLSVPEQEELTRALPTAVELGPDWFPPPTP
jgi:hypothetical protein